MFEACDELANQDFGLRGRYGIRSIVGIDVNLTDVSTVTPQMSVIFKNAYRRILINSRLIVYPREDVLVWDGNVFFGKKRHV
jgi:hypothetical protein